MRKVLFVLLFPFISCSISAQGVFEATLPTHQALGDYPEEIIIDIDIAPDANLRLITKASATVPGPDPIWAFYNYLPPYDSLYDQSYKTYRYGPWYDFVQELKDPVTARKMVFELNIYESPFQYMDVNVFSFMGNDSTASFSQKRIAAAVNVQEVEGEVLGVFQPYQSGNTLSNVRSDTLSLSRIDLNADSIVHQQNLVMPFASQKAGVFFYQKKDSTIRLMYNDSAYIFKLGNPNLIRKEYDERFDDLEARNRFFALTEGYRTSVSNYQDTTVTYNYFDTTERKFSVTLDYHGLPILQANGPTIMLQDSSITALFMVSDNKMGDRIQYYIMRFDKQGKVMERYAIPTEKGLIEINTITYAGNGYYYLGGKVFNDPANYTEFLWKPYFAIVNLYGPIGNDEFKTETASFEVFPSLARNYLKFQTEISKESQVYEVLDINGRLKLKGAVKNGEQVSIQSLSKGTYVFRLVNQPGQVRFMKF